MTPTNEAERRRLLAEVLCARIIATPLGFPLDVRAGIITPAIPARLYAPDFTRKRHIRRNDGTLPCAILPFRHYYSLPPYKA